MSRLMRHLRDEHGQSIVVVAVVAVVFAGLLAFVLDVGSWYRDQRKARNVADAAALAGAHDLPDQTLATASASTYASSNEGSLPADGTPCGAGSPNPCFPDPITIRVKAQVSLHTFIARAFGAPGIPDNVTQSATARLIAATTVSGARPFAFSNRNSYLNGSACSHPGVPCLGPSYIGTFTLGSSGEDDEGSSANGFGLACLDVTRVKCPGVGGGDDNPFGGSTSEEEEGGVNCLTHFWTSWVRDGYTDGTLSIPRRYPRCGGGEEPRKDYKCDGTVPPGTGVTLTQPSVWNFNTSPCDNRNAVNSLVHSGGCAADPLHLEIYVLVVGGHGEDDSNTFGASTEEEEGGGYNAIAWARFCVTGAVFGGTSSGSTNSISGYFDAIDVGGPPVTTCTAGAVGCFYGVGTPALSQ